MAKADKAVESSKRAVHRAKDKISDLERALASAMEELAKKLAFHQEQLVKLRSANSTLQLEVQKLEAFRIRQESEGVEVPQDGEELEAKRSSGLTTSQEQAVLAEVGRRFGDHAGQIHQLLGPLSEILVSVLRGKVN